MPGFNPENINIHDLTIEEPEQKQEVFFDPEKDITTEDWERMNTFLKEIKNLDASSKWITLLSHAEAMKILNPDVNLDLKKSDWSGVSWELEESRKLTPNAAVKRIAMIKNIDFHQEFALKDEEWEKIKGLIERDSATMLTTQLKANVKIIDSSRTIVNATEKDVKRELDQSLNQARNTGNWGRFVDYAANIKILDPTIDFSLSENDWRLMKDKLNDFRGANALVFSEFARDLKILAAQEVKVTDEGLVITMPKPKLGESEVAELPEQRKF